jgi:hypothetical protein
MATTMVPQFSNAQGPGVAPRNAAGSPQEEPGAADSTAREYAVGEWEFMLQLRKFLVLREPFDGRHVLAGVRDRKRQAGLDAPAVQQNRARSTLAVVTALLRAGEAQLMPQGVEQRHPRIDIDMGGPAVDDKRHLVGFHSA